MAAGKEYFLIVDVVFMLLVFFVRLLALLPERLLYIVSDVLSFLLEHLVRYRHDTVMENIARVFPDKTLSERRRLAHGFYRHLADVVVEIVMLSRMKPEELLRRFEISGMENIRRLTDKGQSVILMSAHQGNWEWMLAAVAVSSPCVLDALYRPLHNQAMDCFFMETRSRFRSNMIPADQAIKVILKLRRETRAFGILGDQNPRRRDSKYWVDFMGIETPVVIGPERIAKMTGYSMLYVATERLERGRYRCRIEPLAQPPYGEDGEISRLYMRAVETHIRQQPECWMWSHHRWRYTRKECPESISANDSV